MNVCFHGKTPIRAAIVTTLLKLKRVIILKAPLFGNKNMEKP